MEKILQIRKTFVSLQSQTVEKMLLGPWSWSSRLVYRGVAQLASASGLGPEGPVFESQYPDKIKTGRRVGLYFVVVPLNPGPLSCTTSFRGSRLHCFPAGVSAIRFIRFSNTKRRNPFKHGGTDKGDWRPGPAVTLAVSMYYRVNSCF